MYYSLCVMSDTYAHAEAFFPSRADNFALNPKAIHFYREVTLAEKARFYFSVNHVDSSCTSVENWENK